MIDGVAEWLARRDWFTLIFSLIVWPLLVYGWSRRKVKGVRYLSVATKQGGITIEGKPHNAVDLEFHNCTGSVVYLRGLRLFNRTEEFPVPAETSRDISTDSSPLKFLNPENEEYDLLECTLQTNGRIRTTMPAANLDSAFFHFRPSVWRRFFRRPKYFVIEYTAMVGDKTYNVRTVY
jgi:hypothetical protein